MKSKHQNTFENLTITQSYLYVIYNSINFADKSFCFKCISIPFHCDEKLYRWVLSLDENKKEKKSNEMLNIFFYIKNKDENDVKHGNSLILKMWCLVISILVPKKWST